MRRIFELMQPWYYSDKGERRGPVAFEELRARALRGELDPARDLVWTEPMLDWQAAGSIPGLFDAAPAPRLSDPAPATPTPTAPELTVKILPLPAPSALPVRPEDSNPYAPPETTNNLAAAVPPGSGAPEEIAPGSRDLDLMALFQRAYDLTKRNFWKLLQIGLVFLLLSAGVHAVVEALDRQDLGGYGPGPREIGYWIQQAGSYQNLVCALLAWVANSFLNLGLTRVALNAASGDPMDAGMLLGQGRKILRSLGAEVLFWIIVAAGLVLLVFPGIYMAVRLCLYSEAIVDRNLNPVAALKYSFSLTKNNAGEMLGYMVLSLLLVLAGLLALVVGLAFAVPMATIAFSLTYRFFQYGGAALHDIPGTRTPLLRSHHGRRIF